MWFPYRLAIYGGFAAVIALSAWWYGRAGAMEKFEAFKTEIRIQEERRKVEQKAITERVVIQYRDRIRVVKEQANETKTQAAAVAGTCPAAVGVFHDAAALQLPAATGGADDATVGAATVASTVVENYGRCHQNAEQLKALQEWVRRNAAVK
jgi:hypothetical protein